MRIATELELSDQYGVSRPVIREALARTSRIVLIGTTSATGFMEMALRSGVRHRALSVVTGAFGERFAAIGEHISQTERRAAAAERDAIDRYVLILFPCYFLIGDTLRRHKSAAFAYRFAGASLNTLVLIRFVRWLFVA